MKGNTSSFARVLWGHLEVPLLGGMRHSEWRGEHKLDQHMFILPCQAKALVQNLAYINLTVDFDEVDKFICDTAITAN